MIQKWNKFNESQQTHKSNNARVFAYKFDKLKSLLTEMRDDVGLNRSDIEQLVVNLTDDFDFNIYKYSEGFTNAHCEVEEDRFDHGVSVKPMLKSYHTVDDLINRHIEDPEKKAIILNNMSLNSLEETIQGNNRLFYCYFITLISTEPSVYDVDDSFEDIVDLKDYTDIYEEISSIKKRGASLIGGYCQFHIYHELLGICIYKEIDKSKYLDKTRPDYYSKFPAEIRDDIHKLVIDERIGSDGVNKLLEIINKIK